MLRRAVKQNTQQTTRELSGSVGVGVATKDLYQIYDESLCSQFWEVHNSELKTLSVPFLPTPTNPDVLCSNLTSHPLSDVAWQELKAKHKSPYCALNPFSRINLSTCPGCLTQWSTVQC